MWLYKIYLKLIHKLFLCYHRIHGIKVISLVNQYILSANIPLMGLHIIQTDYIIHI